MKVIAFLPVKGSSSRIENKNIKLLDGKPLFLHTLEKLLDCDFIHEVILDTDSEEIIKLAGNIDCTVFKRDPNFASNNTDGNRLFMNEIENFESDIYIQILCTSPFIEKETVRKAIEILTQESEKNYDSVVLTKTEKLYTWKNERPQYDLQNIPNSIDLEGTTVETMGLYVIKKDAALSSRRRVGDRPFLLEASAIEAIDVNWPEDFELANLIAAGKREKERRLLNNLKGLISSCLLSDILDDMGFPNQVIKGLTPNMKGARFFGRAKTLKLRKLNDGENFKGIYNALHSYETIIPNDVILVENEVSDYAYFGELNANLAIRSGAVGVVVGGKTRDSDEVVKTGLPVFSTGVTCQDVRKRATVESINGKIRLNGVLVTPNDLVFGDSEGVVIIPNGLEEVLLKETSHRLSNEKGILNEISKGVSASDLVDKFGFF